MEVYTEDCNGHLKVVDVAPGGSKLEKAICEVTINKVYYTVLYEWATRNSCVYGRDRCNPKVQNNSKNMISTIC